MAAALRAGEEQERSRRRRAVALGLGALILVVGMGFAGRSLLRPSLVDLARTERAGWENAQVLAPADDPAPQGGEQLLPFERFGIAADSEPPGAEVRVGGRLLGQTPVMTAVECTPGERLAVRFRLAGRPARELATTCRADGLVKLRAKL